MKYKDYYNFELGNRDIYSHNDILGMTVSDLFKNELPIAYQYNTIGVPMDEELQASPNTHQYTDANGKLRWRSSSKTTEELLEEERQRRAALEAENEAEQSQLGTMSGNISPVNNIQRPQMSAPLITETEPSLDNTLMQAIDGLKNKSDDIIQSPKTDGGILDSSNHIILSERPMDKSKILDAQGNQLEQPLDNFYELEETEPYLEENYPLETEEEMLKQQENPMPVDYIEEQPAKLLEGIVTKEVERTNSGEFINQDTEKGTEQPIQKKIPNYPFELNDTGEVVLQGVVNKDSNAGNVMDKLKNRIKNFQETGFNKEDDLDLKGEVKDYLRKHSKIYRNYEGLTPMEAAQKWTSKFLTPLTAREYYGLASELKDDGKPAKKRLRDNDFYKLSDIHNEETRDLIQKNMIKNLQLDPNDPATYDKIKDMDIVVPKSSSNLYKLIKKSDELAEFVSGNYDNLKSNPGQRLDSSIEYARPSKSDIGENFSDKLNRYAIVKKSDISAKMNPDGSMTIWQPDLYDFDYMDPEKETEFWNKVIARANNQALSQQEKKQLSKYGLTTLLTLTPEDIQELLEREGKRKNNK